MLLMLPGNNWAFDLDQASQGFPVKMRDGLSVGFFWREPSSFRDFLGLECEFIQFPVPGGSVGEGYERNPLVIEDMLGDDGFHIVKDNGKTQFLKGFSNTANCRVFVVVHVATRESPKPSEVPSLNLAHQDMSTVVADHHF